MKLIDLNRHGGIGANSLYLQLGDFHLVVDSGLHPKVAGRDALPDFSPLKDVKLDLVIITHCHLDHIGSLPVLLRHHPKVPVVMTHPSRMLIDRMLHNSVNVMLREREEKGIPDLPLYGHEEIDRMLPRLHPHPFSSPKRFSGAKDDLEFTFHPAGHIVGAAGVELTHKRKHVFLTGDVLFEAQRTLPGAMFPQRKFDTLITETTRGATPRKPGQERSRELIRLVDTINATIQRGGSVLIPVFALGRLQEVLAVLHDARKFNRLVEAPIFASGLGMDLADYFDQIAKKTGLVHFTRTIVKELKVMKTPRDLLAGKEPKQGIYVVSSGMMVEKTPSYTVAACLAGHAKHSICFVGYCDPDTPGGHLLAAKPGGEFLFDAVNVKVKLRAQVERFHLSGHADREQLLDYAVRCQPKSVVLTHGDPPAREWFAAELATQLPKAKVTNPTPLQSYSL
jgi:Cft2 family RNA processing exonuclease